MTGTEVVLGLFAACNAARVLAYVPQILRAAHDRDGARAISCWTWGFFAVSHLSTVGYALVIASDWRMAAVFAANAVCCGLIVVITLHKRHGRP